MGPIEIDKDGYTTIVALPDVPVAVCAIGGGAAGSKLREAARKLGAETDEEMLVATVDVDQEPRIAQGLGLDRPGSVVVVRDGFTLGRSSSVTSLSALKAVVSEATSKADKAAAKQQAAAAARGKRHWWRRL